MLKLQQLSKTFGRIKAVDLLDLDVQCGQIRGLLGPNGAGKSTLIRMICGVLAPTSGNVRINGIDLSAEPRRVKQILGYVPEGAPLPQEFLPVEYLKHRASMYNLTGDARKQAVEKWTERCDISDVLRQPIGTLSRGYRQRVSLAAALLHKPKLLVLDEPSTGLDPEQIASFRELLKEVANTSAILYSSHNLAEVETTCDVVSIINRGKLLFDNEFKNLKRDDPIVVIEVSPISIAEKIGGKGIEKLDETWARCKVGAKNAENIATKVFNAGGKIRLLQPESQSLETMYLQKIQDSNSDVQA